MPLYNVSSRVGLSDAQKQKLAKQIVVTHCSLTGAPDTFVNVIYWDDFPLAPGQQYHILSAVRKGRTDELKNQLQAQMHRDVCATLAIEDKDLHIEFMEVPAQWVMEGGHILPNPGEEAECTWLKQA